MIPKLIKRTVLICLLPLFLYFAASAQPGGAGKICNVRDFGATGDGRTIDSGPINNAIMAAAAAGGGTVFFPAGTYASYSIRLKSNISLYIDQGATILAAETPAGS